VLVSEGRTAEGAAALLRALLAVPGEAHGLHVGIAEPRPEAEFTDAVSQAGLLLNQSRRSSEPGASPERPRASESRTIVLAEDDPISAALVRHRLERSGFKVRHFENGAEALSAIREEPPSLVVLDVQMPGMDGFEVLARLKEDDRTRGVRTILFTSLGSESDISRGFELGTDDYLVKPFSPRELIARVLRLVRD
jgi:PleD family two-component response regulator